MNVDEVTLKPHPHELGRAIVGDHVVTFTMIDEELQYEVSGESEYDEIHPEWEQFELNAAAVNRIVNEGEVESFEREDTEGKEYMVRVAGGTMHPKGNPIHTKEWEQAQ